MAEGMADTAASAVAFCSAAQSEKLSRLRQRNGLALNSLL
jgi:hypothetical protein